jgi:pimeloyl-ACP methyl ester carboxylesterase
MDVYASLFIRPPRHEYSVDELGPTRFRLDNQTYVRKDMELTNRRDQKLACSHFVLAKSKSGDAKRPCVVYLHGNSSSRAECYSVLPYLLQEGVTVFCFDFSGSGMSDGDYISLGWYEKEDLQTVLEHLDSEPSIASIGIYGRSMGAATAVFGASGDSRIAACVLDSTFSNISLVATEVIRRKCRIPKILVKAALQVVRREVKIKADFDLLDLVPSEAALQAKCPALFGAAEDDTFVLPSHTRRVYDAWSGDKTLYQYTGGHNGARPSWFLVEAAAFLAQRLCERADMAYPAACSRRLKEKVPAPVASAARRSASAGSMYKENTYEEATLEAKRRKSSGCCSSSAAAEPVVVPFYPSALKDASVFEKSRSQVPRTRSALEAVDMYSNTVHTCAL